MTNGRTFFDLLRSSAERTRTSQEIRTAVRSRAQGKTRDETRQILVEEFRSRGLEVPAQPWLDLRLDGILATDSPMDRAKNTVEVIGALGEMGRKMFKMVRTHTTDGSNDDPGFDDSRGVLFGDKHRKVEIDIGDDVQEWIENLDEESSFSFRQFGSLRLDLKLLTDGSVVAFVGDRQVGTLSEHDADVFRPCFSTFGAHHDTLLSRGSRYRTPDGHWHVYVNLPDEHFLRLSGLDIQPGEDLPLEALRQLMEDPLPPTPSGQLHYDRQRKRWVDGPDPG